MTPIEIHNEQLAGRIIKHLERRNFNAHYCATASEAIELVKSIIPEGSSIAWGGSQTIREMGLTQSLIDSGNYQVIDRDKATTPEQTRQCYLDALTWTTSSPAPTPSHRMASSSTSMAAATVWQPSPGALTT